MNAPLLPELRFPRAALTACLLAGPILAQGEFVNFEAIQVAPIDIATVEGASYVVACNTPDDCIEIYDAVSRQLVPGGRIPVGLRPVTVRWNPTTEKLYTCNFIGDSVSVIELNATSNGVDPRLERTVQVGDEPTDIVFRGNEAIVALHSRALVVHLDDVDLLPVGANAERLLSDPATSFPIIALKAPRMLGVLDDDRLLAINTRGGLRTDEYDADLYIEDPTPPAGVPGTLILGGLGTTNSAFAYDSEGDRLFVVGSFADAEGALGVHNVAQLPTGFVRSHLWIVDLSPQSGGGPALIPEAPASGSTLPFDLFQSIDLNRDYEVNTFPPQRTPIGSLNKRVSQPMSVELVTDPVTEEVTHVVIACFGTDDVLVLEPADDFNGGWKRTHIDIDLLSTGPTYGATGPRGLAYDALNDEVWILNRLDNSLAVFTPGNGTVTWRGGLQNDPTPSTIRRSRKFLYSAHETSGSHMVSCASCHVDGRTDGLRWDLGEEVATATLVTLDDDLNDDRTEVPQDSHFRPDKKRLVTQTLQGLVNFHTESVDLQYVMTNAPYHWRGDKETFLDFNEAFVNLQGMSDRGGAAVINGLKASEMRAFRDFINTIHYPPNPEQPRSRTYNARAKLGIQLYHEAPSMGPQRSCVTCHQLPEGSGNTFTLQSPLSPPTAPPMGFTQAAILETAALRGLFQREQAFIPENDFGATDDDWIRVADLGLQRAGEGDAGGDTARSINDFIHQGFGGFTSSQAAAITQFNRQFDWGVGPNIGQVLSIPGPTPASLDETPIDEMEANAEEANSGVAVYLRTGAGPTVDGYWYDCSTVAGPVYREVSGGTTKSRADLLGSLQAGDLLIFQAVPTGMERRVAHPDGTPTPLAPPAPGVVPTQVELLDMVPNTAYEGITQFSTLVDPPVFGGQEEFRSIRARLELEEAARQDGIPGVATAPRHEPPRRFRVAGFDIRHGAKLRIGLLHGSPSSPSAQSGEDRNWIELDIAPTKYRDGGRVVWETAEELDARMTMAFLNGGPELDWVQDTLQHLTANLDPDTWNHFEVEVINQSDAGSEFSNLFVKTDLGIADTR